MVDSIVNQQTVSDESEFEKQLGQLTMFLRVMRQGGLDLRKALQMPVDDLKGRQRLIAYWNAGAPQISIQTILTPGTASAYERARLILGKDFISAEEIALARKLDYSDEQLQMFQNTLPGEDVLVWLRDNGYTLVAGPPKQMSLLEIRDLNPAYFYVKTGGWYEQKFSYEDLVQATWLGLRKDIVHNSASLSWDDQQKLITGVERVPNAGEFVWGITTYKAVRGIYLFERMYARTSSVSDGSRVFLGGFDQSGLDVYDGCWSGRCDLGVASARIFNPVWRLAS